MEQTRRQTASQSQKLMIFVLTMALYGLATLFTELIPKFGRCHGRAGIQ